MLQRNLVSWLLSHPGHGSLMLNLAFVSTPKASRLTKPMLSPDWIRWMNTVSPLPVGRERMPNTMARRPNLWVFTIAISAQAEHFMQICTDTYSVQQCWMPVPPTALQACSVVVFLHWWVASLHCQNNFPRAMINLEWVPGAAAWSSLLLVFYSCWGV